MLKILNSEIDKTIKYLNSEYPVNKEVFLHICEGYDTIKTDTGVGFGAFVKSISNENPPVIYIAGDMPNDDYQMIEALAHEYRHFLQWCNGEEFSEEQAEIFGKQVAAKLFKLPERRLLDDKT